MNLYYIEAIHFLERQDINMKFYAGLDVGGTSGRVKFSAEDKTLIGEYLGRAVHLIQRDMSLEERSTVS